MKLLLYYLTVCIVIYLLCAFSQWSFNPADWHWVTRWFFGVFVLAGVLIWITELSDPLGIQGKYEMEKGDVEAGDTESGTL